MLGNFRAYHQHSISAVYYYRITFTVCCKIYYRKLFTDAASLVQISGTLSEIMRTKELRRGEEGRKGGSVEIIRVKGTGRIHNKMLAKTERAASLSLSRLL